MSPSNLQTVQNTMSTPHRMSVVFHVHNTLILSTMLPTRACFNRFKSFKKMPITFPTVINRHYLTLTNRTLHSINVPEMSTPHRMSVVFSVHNTLILSTMHPTRCRTCWPSQHDASSDTMTPLQLLKMTPKAW